MTNTGKFKLLSLLLVFLIAGCQVYPPAHSHVEDGIGQTLQSSINQNAALSSATQKRKQGRLRRVAESLAPKISVNVPASDTPASEHRFNVSVTDMPIRTFFMYLVQDTAYDIVVDQDVKGTVSLILNQVTVPEAIQAACDAYDLQYIKTEYGYRIQNKKLVSRIYKVNYLNIARNGKSNMSVSPGNIADKVGTTGGSSGSTATSTTSKSNVEASSVETISQSNFWKKLDDSLKGMIGTEGGRNVVIDPDAGVIYVKAYPDEQRTVAQYLDKIQKIMNKQVIIEAKILEVNLSAEYQSGIKWDLLGIDLDGTKQASATPFELDDFYSIRTSIGTTFSLLMRLLNEQGRIGVLSSPHISTLNNQKAIIKVGGDRFFITGISSTTSGALTSDTTQNAEFTPFFSGVALDVTPEINPDKTVTLQIHPVISTVENDERAFTISGKASSIPMARSTVRESDSIVRAKSGQVIILGGLMEKLSKNFANSMPGIDNTRLKESFGRHNRYSNRVELVILLKPIIVDNDAIWNDSMSNEKENFENMRGNFMYTLGVAHKKTVENGHTLPVPAKHMMAVK